MGDWERAVRASRMALALQDSAKNRANLGLALLGVGKWEEAWPLYTEISGRDKSSRKMQYVDEPTWDGSKGKSIVVYEEQGIGDAISFASVIPDVLKDAAVVMDVRIELEGLFQRSFPEATVYGSFSGIGKVGQELGVYWEDWRSKHKIEASIPIGGLPRFYRPTPESCPGTPYLVPDETKVLQWQTKLRTGKPVIGIAWSGGMEHTGAANRRWTLEQLLPVFRSVDAVWVSLQYKDASEEIEAFKAKHPEIDLRQYPEATLTDDYDDTAALVMACDMVFSMQTAVIHLAGAIGKECWCFVNKHSQWRYGPNTQTSLPWYESVRLFRNIDGWPLEQAAGELRAKYGN
jgi:hypothetical protein